MANNVNVNEMIKPPLLDGRCPGEARESKFRKKISADHCITGYENTGTLGLTFDFILRWLNMVFMY